MFDVAKKKIVMRKYIIYIFPIHDPKTLMYASSGEPHVA